VQHAAELLADPINDDGLARRRRDRKMMRFGFSE